MKFFNEVYLKDDFKVDEKIEIKVKMIDNIINLKQSDALRLCKDTEEIDVIIELSKHPNAQVRKKSLFQMCPCRVKGDINNFWDRVFDMVNDSDPIVRAQVLHTLCDGSPNHLEYKVIECIEKFNYDSDKDIRRKAHKVLASYSRTGKWNIL